MDLLSMRQKISASNIANADTPGYKTKDIDFAAELQRATKQLGSPTVIEPQGLATKNDGNNVSIDREARLLAENALRFNAAASFMKTQIRLVKSALQEGR
jgi:flagellar basal-body rod protein FlgB